MNTATKSTTVILLALGMSLIAAGSAPAATLHGRVTFVGTLGEHHNGSDGYQAQFRFRLADSTCTNQSQPMERWIEVKSGRMEGDFAHNDANTRNAFSVLLAAFLSGKMVQIDGVPNCNASNTIHLWSSNIGIF